MSQEPLDKPLLPNITFNNIGIGGFSVLVSENLDENIIIPMETVRNKISQLSSVIIYSISDINEASCIDFF